MNIAWDTLTQLGTASPHSSTILPQFHSSSESSQVYKIQPERYYWVQNSLQLINNHEASNKSTDVQSENAESSQLLRLDTNATGARIQVHGSSWRRRNCPVVKSAWRTFMRIRVQIPVSEQQAEHQTPVIPAPGVPVLSSGVCTCTGPK